MSLCLQTAHQVGGWIPVYTIGFTVRQTTILEFSPTLIPIILAGKVGSNIASQLGTMRVTEQIDALEEELSDVKAMQQAVNSSIENARALTK